MIDGTFNEEAPFLGKEYAADTLKAPTIESIFRLVATTDVLFMFLRESPVYLILTSSMSISLFCL